VLASIKYVLVRVYPLKMLFKSEETRVANSRNPKKVVFFLLFR